LPRLNHVPLVRVGQFRAAERTGHSQSQECRDVTGADASSVGEHASFHLRLSVLQRL
jgi:hypothetical protein